jgi:secondary thiamine-phosphate synthase enzyme
LLRLSGIGSHRVRAKRRQDRRSVARLLGLSAMIAAMTPDGSNVTVHTDYLWFNTPRRREIVRITDDIARIVEASGVRDGMVLVSAMHITAGVYVNDWESGLIADIEEWLEHLAPARPDYRHHQTGEDNADAHLKRTILGHQVMLPITNGALDLGPWEQVFYAEFDGKRRKRVVVKVMGIA